MRRCLALAVSTLLLLLSSLLILDARSPKTKRAKRTAKRTSADSRDDNDTGYDASGCSDPWDVGEDEGMKLPLGDDHCDFEEVSADALDERLFAGFALRRPLIVRQSNTNKRAREFMADRCEVLRQYGGISIELGDPYSLARHGRSNTRMSLGQYLDAPFQVDNPLYFFDRSGQWSNSMDNLSKLVSVPHAISLTPQPKAGDSERPITFAIGKNGSGIGLHQHQDAWNEVLLGRKRWTVYPGNPGGVPSSAGYNPALSHATWLQTVYPRLPEDSMPMECIQRAGDVVYIPSGWHHATLNIGDTAAIAMQAATYPPHSPRFKGNLSKAIIVAAARIGDEAGILRGLALAREAVELDPLEGDHRQILAHALQLVGMDGEANQQLGAAVELMPSNPTSYVAAGAVLNGQGKWNEAIAILRRGQAILQRDGSAQEQSLAAALTEQLETAQLALANAR